METLKLYASISKVDPEKRMVYGYASTEAKDSQGEVVKIEALKKAMPDYMKFGNIREMHQPSAVGITKEASFDEKGMYIGAKIVDDVAWNKVKEEVYKGFSIGGRVEMMDGNNITGLRLTEISLVDRPANPESTFDLFKSEDFDEIAKDMHRAAMLTSMGEGLDYMSDDMQRQGKDTTHIDAVTQAIADAATKELETPDDDGDEDNSSNLDIAMADKTEDLEKKSIDAKQRAAISDSDFAYIDAKGGRHLPIEDEDHVRNAMARFDQTQFDSDSAKSSAKKKICSKAKSFGIEGDFCKIDDEADLEKADPYALPSDDEIAALLTKAGMPSTEAAIAIVKGTLADEMIGKIKDDQAKGMDLDAAKAEVAKELTKAVSDITKMLESQVTSNLDPLVHYMITKNETPTETIVEQPTAPVETVETPTLTKSDQDINLAKAEAVLAKFEDSLAKAEQKISVLEERLGKLEKSEAPSITRSVHAVDRFGTDASGDEAKLLKEIDDLHPQLIHNPSQEVLAKRDELMGRLQSLRKS